MSRRVSVNQLMRANVVSYDSAGSDEATCAESDAANDGCVCADGHDFFDPRFHRRPVSVATPRCQIVSQNGVWTKKYVVCYVHVLPDADAVFDGYVVADADSALDESVIADVAVRADNRILQYVGERPDTSAFTNRICFHECFLVDEVGVFRFDHKVDDNNRCGGLRPTAALQYQVSNCDNNDKKGYDGHPVKSHRSGLLPLTEFSSLETNCEPANAEKLPAWWNCSASLSMTPRSDR